MTDHGVFPIDPRIVEAWVKGWTLARKTSPPVAEGQAFRVDVGWPQQRVRYVFPRLTNDVGLLAERIADPWMFIKVCACSDEVRPMLPSPWVVQPPSYMMIQDRAAPSLPTPLSPGYKPVPDQGLQMVQVMTDDGAVAASGHMAVVGDFVIYDRIETDPAHRRRGLGRFIMGELARMGGAQGATRGVLVATEDGRALYEPLGFSLYSPYTSAVIPAA